MNVESLFPNLGYIVEENTLVYIVYDTEQELTFIGIGSGGLEKILKHLDDYHEGISVTDISRACKVTSYDPDNNECYDVRLSVGEVTHPQIHVEQLDVDHVKVIVG